MIAPYLVDVSGDSATVAFHLHEPVPAVLRLLSDEAKVFESARPARSHFVRVSGLAPGRSYRYEVICGAGAPRTPAGDDSYQIRTAGRPGESFTFAVYGDPRPGETRTRRHHEQVMEQALAAEPVFCLVLGDMVDDGAAAGHWEAFFETESELLRRCAIYPVIGDNDHAGGRGLWRRYFPHVETGRYHFEWGGVHFFGMNAWGSLGAQRKAELDEKSEQLRWLEAELASEEVRQAPFRVVFLHDPVFISRGRSSDLMRRVWAPLFERSGVDVVFSSWHMYERSRHGQVAYLISGGGGAELVWLDRNPAFPSEAEARRHHFCRVDVKQGSMEIRAVAVDGTVLDSLSLLPRSPGTWRR